MPWNRSRKTGVGRVSPGPALVTLFLLSGCVGGFDGPSMLAAGKGQSPTEPAATTVSTPVLTKQGAVVSPLIESLQTRQSILPQGSSFGQVASSVLEASKGAALAELRVARLTAKAQSKNWLPKIGPNVSLTSLSSIAAGILVEQAIFDNGRRKAERAYAAADVEVAAVSLAEDLNDRVYQGLKHYIVAQRSAELMAVTQQSLGDLSEFDRIMGLRVEGGLSDRSEQQVLTQKVAEAQSLLSGYRQAQISAQTELNAMASRPLDDVRGLQALPADADMPEPLAVMRARGEGARMLAEAQIARAGVLPGLGASADVDISGNTDASLNLGGAGLGFGTGDTLAALEATKEVAARQVAEAEENAHRSIVSLDREIAMLTQQQIDGAEVLRQTEGNLELFKAQYKAGRRTLLELVGQYESFARMQRDQASLKYDIAALRLEIARNRGVLVNGAEM